MQSFEVNILLSVKKYPFKKAVLYAINQSKKINPEINPRKYSNTFLNWLFRRT